MQKPQGHIVRDRDARRLARVYLELVRFDERAKADLSKIPLPDIDDQLQDMEQLVGCERMGVAAIVCEGKRVGSFAYSVLPLYGEQTLWIVAIGADSDALPDGTSLFPELGDEILKLAKTHKCRWVRADTSRPPVFAQLVKLGFLPGMVQLYHEIKE